MNRPSQYGQEGAVRSTVSYYGVDELPRHVAAPILGCSAATRTSPLDFAFGAPHGGSRLGSVVDERAALARGVLTIHRPNRQTACQ